MFHGLNERSWQKYLSWAYYLTNFTDSYVILFPISFHINRSPVSWKDRRSMVSLLNRRKPASGEIQLASFVNAAISDRLTEDPLRFFRSGYQTVNDITRLAQDIRGGKHPIVPPAGTLNIFAYSIGAFMAEILMIGNPGIFFQKANCLFFAEDRYSAV